MNFGAIRSLLAVITIIIIVLLAARQMFYKKYIFTPNFIAKTAIFSAISIILYVVPFLSFPLPFFPPFLEIHLDEVPALIAGFAYGPMCGTLVVFIKTIIKLPFSTTACVGELADFVYSFVFVFSASLFYKKMRSFKGAIISVLIGTAFQMVVASTFTTFVMLDIYSVLYPGLTKEVILSMCAAINPAIKDLNWSFMLMVAIPFNALKDTAVVLITILLYKKLHTFIDRIGHEKNRI